VAQRFTACGNRTILNKALAAEDAAFAQKRIFPQAAADQGEF